ncbi:MAG: hypothetical protein WC379_06225 [Methanoregula sp.]
MSKKKRGVILLALLLAAMAMVPCASAGEQNENALITDEIAAMAVDSNSVQMPQLHYNSTQPGIILTNELVLDADVKTDQIKKEIESSQAPVITGIPFGAIVHHSADGVTTVFDSTGEQLFSAEDSKSAMVNTPNEPLPATSVFEVPDKSLIVENKSIINVFYEKNRILTIITDPAIGRKSIIARQQSLDRWIEYGETASITTVGQFSARWNVPKSPTLVHQYTPGSSLDGTVSTVWNGLETSSGNYLLQPVLEWYVRDTATSPYPTIANWSIATWWVPPGNGIHSTRRYGIPSTGELILPGHQVQGNMMHSGAIWFGAISDLSLGVSSTLFLDTTQSDQLTYQNLRAFTVLEGWNPYLLSPSSYDYRYIPGPVTFGNIVINDIDGNNAIPASIPATINSATWNPTNYGLSVTNSAWPTSITLTTGNI